LGRWGLTIGQRLARALATLLVASIIIFAVIRLVHGNPLATLLSTAGLSNPKLVQQTRVAYGLNKPILTQYFLWLGMVAQGHLGNSLVTGQSVSSMLVSRLGASLLLGVTAALIGIPVGVIWGIVAAYVRGPGGSPLRGGTLFGAIVPAYAVGIALSYLLSVRWGLLPASGMYSPVTPGGVPDLLRHLVLPALTLAVTPAAIVARITYAKVEDLQGSDFVRTGLSLGLRPRRIAMSHTLPNALLPMITIGGLLISAVITNAVLVESVFAWPGIGTMLVMAVETRDYPVVEAGALVIVIIYVIGSWIADSLYQVADPRIRSSGNGAT
jgi:peptide/nickel transport system permease protein